MSKEEQHRLRGDTLVIEPGGIVAYCSCGWESRKCFSSFIASNEYDGHVEERGTPEDKKVRNL